MTKELVKLPQHIENILKERYYVSGESSWTQIAQRLSEPIYPPMFGMIESRTFIPSTPTIMNLNTKGERKGTLSSCFILDIEDSLDGIMASMREAAFVTKAAGGVGFNFSKLRGSNEVVKSIGANSGGVMGFIQIFDAVLDGVRQGGRRRGAGMSMLSVYHPDILKFIDAKYERTDVFTRSNFSVALDDEFYFVLENAPATVFQTRDVRFEYNTDGSKATPKLRDLKDDKGNVYTYKMLWDKIIHHAWKRAEPGIFNMSISADRCSCKHITRNVFCNPCSEYVHIPCTSCNLASLNLLRFVKGDKFDWVAFEKAVEESIIYMNGIIDANDYPLEKIRKETLNVRPIGLGFMGLAHAMFELNIPYSSQEGYDFSEKLTRFMTLVAMRQSVKMAKELGKSYPYFDLPTFMDANKRFFTEAEFMGIDVAQLQADIAKYGIWNSCVTSIAPTGTISYIADCSSGLEPVFGLVFTRKIEKENKTYEHVYLVDPVFRAYVEKNHLDNAEKIYKYVSSNKGSCQGCPQLSVAEQIVFKVAGDITPDWHLQILAAVANNVSLSVSKTINLPTNCSEQELSEVFLKAHKLGIIGVTVYRDGSREGILVHDDCNRPQGHIIKTVAPKRPKELLGEIWPLRHKNKNLYVAVGLDKNGLPYEVFTGVNTRDKVGHDVGKIIRKARGKYHFVTVEGEEYHLTNGNNDDNADALCRTISWGLRHGGGIEFLVHQLEKTEGDLMSFSKVICRVLKKYITDGTAVHGEECPDCGSKLVRKEGCISCPACGHSKCG